MNVRLRTNMAMGTLLLGILFSVLLYRFSYTVQLSRLDDLDKKLARTNTKQAINVFWNYFDDLHFLVPDLAVRDDTYRYVHNRSQEFIDQNITRSNFLSQRVNIIQFFDTNGKPLFGRAYDLEILRYVDLPEGFLEGCQDKKAGILTYGDLQVVKFGIMNLPSGPVYLYAHPILDSEARGPSRGTLVMGRFITPSVIDRIESLAAVSFNLIRLDEVMTSDFFSLVRSFLDEAESIVVKVGDRNTLDGFSYIDDLSGRPGLIMMTRTVREAYKSVMTFNMNATFVTLLAVLFLGVVIVWRMERNLLGRLVRLDQKIVGISRSGDLTERLDSTGNDELSRLADNINMMLSTILSTQENLDESRDRLKKSLKEKEILLKEVHHRVKNNLQAIASVFETQAAFVKDSADLDHFREGQNFIRTVALIHQQLYTAENDGRVDFGKYLGTLCDMLLKAYQDVAKRIEIEIEAQTVFLNTETAIPLGLVANEVMSNSFKYAFPGDRSGKISVFLRNEGNGKFTLTIEDNGVGLPENYEDRQSSTLGHALVRSIVSHLNGHVEMKSGNGLKTTIEFVEYYECETIFL